MRSVLINLLVDTQHDSLILKMRQNSGCQLLGQPSYNRKSKVIIFVVNSRIIAGELIIFLYLEIELKVLECG